MKLLVSVRNVQEADDAVAGGADWIDLKEPSAGALGAVNAAVANSAVKTIGNGSPISAALGELINWPTSSALLTIPEIKVVKLGLAGCNRFADWQSRWNDAFDICSQQAKQLAAVIYADWQKVGAPCPEEVLSCALRAGTQYLLIDTFEKQGLSSIEILSRKYTAHLLRFARQRGLATVLAGSLRLNDISIVAGLPVDVLAIRGAVCGGNRNSALDLAKVRVFRRHMGIASENAKELNSYLTTRN